MRMDRLDGRPIQVHFSYDGQIHWDRIGREAWQLTGGSMRNLMQTHTLSWAQSVKLALDAEGIPATILDEFSPGYLGFAGRIRVAVLNDEDLPRAAEVLAGLRPLSGSSAPLPSWRYQKRGLWLIAASVAFVITGGAIAGAGFPGTVPLGLVVAGGVLFLWGAVLIIIGPRLDPPSSHE